ncbi:MAG: acyltransferase family protein [Cellvibrionaceae bacterium]|nr:acyltransferase family protein [Cellvibrionaceae bacterium]
MVKNSVRLHPIDLLRGFIILFMILDHAMVYCSDYQVSDPMAVPGTDAAIFLSRFIAHFCAPLFVFLAGLSAALTENRFQNTRQFAHSLIRRALVMMLLEFTIISWSWSFNPLFPMLYAQVIWAIAWGFLFLGLLRLLGVRAVFIFGLIAVLGHNLLDTLSFSENTWQHYVWSVLHQKNVLALPFDFKVRTTYPVLPIAGLMCLAYMAGRYYQQQGFAKITQQRALLTGVLCLASYAILRGFNLYGDAGEFQVQASLPLTLMSFFNPTKYPLSLQFMLLTVGLGLIALVALKQLRADFSQGFLQVLGKTSMFSYIAHLYLLHLISWLLIPLLGFKFSEMTYGDTLIGLPAGYGLCYGATYILAAVTAVMTLLLAQRYIEWKQANKQHVIAQYI